MPTTPPPAGWQWARQGQWARDLSREGRGTAAPAARRPGPDSRSAPQSPATEAAGASARRLVCASNEVSCGPGVCLRVCIRLGQNSQLRCQEPLGRRAPTLRSMYKMHIFGGQPSTLITCQVLFHVPSAGSRVSLFRPLGGGHRPKAPRDRVAQRLLLPVGGSEAGIAPGLCVTRPETLLLWLR